MRGKGPIRSSERPTLEEVKRAAFDTKADWLPRVFPNGKAINGTFFLGSANGEAGESFPIKLRGGPDRIKDFGADAWSGDFLALWAKGLGIEDQGEAYDEWLARHGYRPTGRPKNSSGPESSGQSKAKPEPDEKDTYRGDGGPRDNGHDHGEQAGAQRHRGAKREWGIEAGYWIYHHEDGSEHLDAVRFDQPGVFDQKTRKQKKAFHHYDLEDRRWITGSWVRPLYRLHELAANPAESVVLVAGERCVDALTEIGIFATTNCGGESSIGQTDLDPLTAREVTIWRDNDPAGEQWQAKAIELLKERGCKIKLVTIPKGAPETWDAADALADEGLMLLPADRVRELVAEAVELPPPKPRFRSPVMFDDCQLNRAVFWKIFEIMPRCDMAMIYGKGGAGKTFLMTATAIGLASGLFFGHEAEPGPVIYAAFEREDDAEDRLNAAREKLGLTGRKLPIKLLRLTGEKLNQETADYIIEQSQLLAEQYGKPTSAIMIDTVSAAIEGGEDEEGLKQLKTLGLSIHVATGGTIVWVHHEGKGEGQGPRGHSNLSDGCTVVWHIVEREDGSRTVWVEKANRGRAHIYLFAFRLVPFEAGRDERGKPIELCEVQMTDLDAALASQVRMRGATNNKGGKGDGGGRTGQRQTVFLRTLYQLFRGKFSGMDGVDRNEHRSKFLYEWNGELQKQKKEPLRGEAGNTCYRQTLASLLGKRVMELGSELLVPIDQSGSSEF